MSNRNYYIVNAITLYRILAAPLLLIFIYMQQFDLFRWFLCFSFFTDLIDGYLARKFKVVSIMGARFDSIGDDLTVFVALVGLFVFKPEFIHKETVVLAVLFSIYIIQTTFSLVRYKKISSFHTYLAKLAALLQGVFLTSSFILPEPLLFLFYLAVFVTAIQLIEEIALVVLLPKWEANVKGLFWVLKRKKHNFS